MQKNASKDSHRSQKVLNTLILLNCDISEYKEHKSRNEDISRILQISMKKIDLVKRRFVEEGLSIALEGHKGERIYKKKVDGDFEAHLIALSCSAPPPEGFSRWSLRMLADTVVELEYIDGISHETVRHVLKKRIKTLEKKGLGYSSIAKWRFCGQYGGNTEALMISLLQCLQK